MPDPELLKVHAVIGNFLHTMSGVAESLQQVHRDLEEQGCLAPDGNSNFDDLLGVSLSLNLARQDQVADEKRRTSRSNRGDLSE